MTSIGDVADSVRWRGFVGRHRERRAFDDALAGRTARRVLFVHGPGGLGKTLLVLRLAAEATHAGRAVRHLDGLEVDPSPEGFRQALGADPFDVLLVDTYEQLAPVDGWFRRTLVPSLPAGTVVVVAGREPPDPRWRTDPGWREIVAVLPLSPLDPAESALLLTAAGVDPGAHERIQRLGRGNPLALALLADAALTGGVPASLADAPDLISALLEALVRDVPSDAHRAGLATCATAWLTTEDLLRATVGDAADGVWAWLRRRPFVVGRPHGLTPHDLTRDVLDAEFERRSPDRYRVVHRAVHDYVVARLRTARGMDRQLLAQHLFYLHRRSPFTATFHALRARGSAAVVPARPREHAEIVGLLRAAHGPATAALAEGWLAGGWGETSVVRNEDGVAGLAYHVICPSGSPLEERDPVVRAILDHVARTAPVRPGEQVEIGRFVLGRHGRQRDEHGVLAACVSSIVDWCTRPLAWSFATVVDPEFYGPLFDYLGFPALVEVTVDGLDHVVYGNDWRRFPVDAWLELMSEREHLGGSGPPPARLLRPAPLTEAAFRDAVRAALADLTRPARLADNPLVGGALGRDAPALRATIEDAVVRLREEPRGDHLRAVLHRTFVRPAPTREAAAEVLGLPFSTYRRHLARAVDALADALWAREMGSD